MKKIIITGGAGFIGSHLCTLLTRKGYRLLAIDNLVRGKKEHIDEAMLCVGDIADKKFLSGVFADFKPDSVIHLAALCSPAESLQQAQAYYLNHVTATATLLDVMVLHHVKNIIFASSSTVYAERVVHSSYVETDTCQPANPYSSGKWLTEEEIKKYAAAYGLRYVIMRHFNPSGVGIDETIGGLPAGRSHAVAALMQASLGIMPGFSFYGTDYPTPDGSSMRDYVHVADIAHAHACALDYLAGGGDSLVVNIGTGHDISLKALMGMVEKKCGKAINVHYKPRLAIHRPFIVADNTLARQRLHWQPKHSSIDNIIDSTLRWFTRNYA